MTILPAIIPKNYKHLEEEVAKVKDFVTTVQVDIADGLFVKNKTWPYAGDHGEFELLARQETGLPFWEDIDYEFHLMIQEPEKTVEDWVNAGASSVVLQIEAVVADLGPTIDICKANEVKLGLSIKPSTDISVLALYADKIDFIQCMGSDDLGHHGAQLDESVFAKIKELRALYPSMPIAIDIGVNEDTAADFVAAGATKLIIGGAIFNSPTISETIKFFQSL